ncbi:unnamed protein product, partial [Allacma fusca]
FNLIREFINSEFWIIIKANITDYIFLSKL